MKIASKSPNNGNITNVTVTKKKEDKFEVTFTFDDGRVQFYTLHQGCLFLAVNSEESLLLVKRFLVDSDGVANVTDEDVRNLQAEVRQGMFNRFFSSPLITELTEEELLEAARIARIRSVQVG